MNEQTLSERSSSKGNGRATGANKPAETTGLAASEKARSCAPSPAAACNRAGEETVPGRTSKVYADYPEQPYIAPDRDLAAWEAAPDRFPYGIVAKNQMKRLPEGILPGHVIMLWRVHFNTYTTESPAPRYFEYRYGVDAAETLATLEAEGYIRLSSARESADLLSVPVLKRLLAAHGLPVGGKKADLLARYRDGVSDEAMAADFDIRRYVITPEGSAVLARYDDLIQKHGPKDL